MILRAVTGPMPGQRLELRLVGVVEVDAAVVAGGLAWVVDAQLGHQHLDAILERLGEVQRLARGGQVRSRREASGGLDGIADTVTGAQSVQPGPGDGAGDVDDDLRSASDAGVPDDRSAAPAPASSGSPQEGRCRSERRHEAQGHDRERMASADPAAARPPRPVEHGDQPAWTGAGRRRWWRGAIGARGRGRPAPR